ncbi:hypothetical protein HOY34_21560 [Xinfangfangia sp. D13-10-4-6]|uniref:hypothetical protein n=1 Tax=Pseudogemmobacter hezensis TaxID=2737662 RepID=UPI001557718D|nr:hypothetical protein [Pseudogemmobacter hezensis]NPD17765.1 hypothetical protein [Pseudogemmobacter hezensis]
MLEITIPETLQALNDRLKRKFSRAPDTVDFLPEDTADFEEMASLTVEKLTTRPETKRSDMEQQIRLLSKTFAGQSELELLHAVVISYLRRDTPHTQKAWTLFRRLWAEQSDFLVERLSVRWLISALQTFYDHSDMPDERIAGGMGFIYGNLIKIYETEHHARRRNRPPEAHAFKNKSVPGMFGFSPGDDILINLNVLMLDAAKRGGIAGAPLMRLIDAVARGNTVFQRTDALASVHPFSEHPRFTLSFEGRKCPS